MNYLFVTIPNNTSFVRNNTGIIHQLFVRNNTGIIHHELFVCNTEWYIMNHSLIWKVHRPYFFGLDLSQSRELNNRVTGWDVQRTLWLWQTWEYHGPRRQSNRANWKNSVIRRYRKPLEPDLKSSRSRVLTPIVWHQIRWSPWNVWKSVFQTNDTQEPKTQGAEWQGPGTPFQWPFFFSELKYHITKESHTKQEV